jgi:hypothetical protein
MSFGIPTTKATYEQLFLVTSTEEGIVRKDLAYAYRIIAGEDDKRTVLTLMVGSSYENSPTPDIRRIIITCNGDEPIDIYTGTEHIWFHHAEYNGKHLIKETKLAETNEFNKLVPMDLSNIDFNLQPPNDYQDEFQRLNQFLFSFIDYNETFNGSELSDQRPGRFIFTEKGKEEIGDGHLIMIDLSSTNIHSMISKVCENYFLK